MADVIKTAVNSGNTTRMGITVFVPKNGQNIKRLTDDQMPAISASGESVRLDARFDDITYYTA